MQTAHTYIEHPTALHGASDIEHKFLIDSDPSDPLVATLRSGPLTLKVRRRRAAAPHVWTYFDILDIRYGGVSLFVPNRVPEDSHLNFHPWCLALKEHFRRSWLAHKPDILEEVASLRDRLADLEDALND